MSPEPAPAAAQIRPAESRDMPAVDAIMTYYVEHTVITFTEVAPTVQQWEQRLVDMRSAGHPFLVAELDGEVAGFAHVSQWRPKHAYRHTVEDTIYLRDGTGGRGVGTALLGALIAECAAAGHQQMIAVLTEEGTEASKALHLKFGFTEVGTLTGVGLKHGRSLNTVLLQRALTDDGAVRG